MNVSSCMKVSFNAEGRRFKTPAAMTGKVFCYLWNGTIMVFSQVESDGLVSQFLDDIDPVLKAIPDPTCLSEFLDECRTLIMRGKALRAMVKKEAGARKALEQGIERLQNKCAEIQ